MSEIVERALLIGFGLILFMGVLGSLFSPFFQSIQINNEPLDNEKYDNFIDQLDKSIRSVSNDAFPRIILDISNFVNESNFTFGVIISPNERLSILHVKITNKNATNRLPLNYELKYNFPIFIEGNYTEEFKSILVVKNQLTQAVNIIFSEE